MGHYVQIGKSDIRVLGVTDTAVAHNFMANMRLATGFAPVAAMLDAGVPVGLGTDNSKLSDTVNPLSDVGAMTSGHKEHYRNPGLMPAQKAFDMITIDVATAVGRGDSLGSIEAGKQADIAIVDLYHPHLTPSPDPVFTLVHNAQGFEVETVICAGTAVMQNREILSFDDDVDKILSAASRTASDLVAQTGFDYTISWVCRASARISAQQSQYWAFDRRHGE